MQEQIDKLNEQMQEAIDTRNYKRALELSRLIECAREFLREAR